MQTITVRELEGSEMPGMLSLVAIWNRHVDEHALHERLAEMLKIGYRCIGAFVDDELAGIAGFWIGTRFWCGRYLDADNVIVAEKWRNAGLGHRLMEWLHTEAETQGCEVVVLDAYLANFGAHRFYERLGYEKVGFHFIRHIRR